MSYILPVGSYIFSESQYVNKARYVASRLSTFAWLVPVNKFCCYLITVIVILTEEECMLSM